MKYKFEISRKKKIIFSGLEGEFTDSNIIIIYNKHIKKDLAGFIYPQDTLTWTTTENIKQSATITKVFPLLTQNSSKLGNNVKLHFDLHQSAGSIF